MFVEQLLTFIQDSWLARFLDMGPYTTMVVQTFHILGFTMVLAIVVTLSLRVQERALCGLPLPHVTAVLRLPYRLGLSLTLGAGVLLFLPRALTYGLKDMFVWKMLLLALAIGAQALLHRKVAQVVEEDVGARPELNALALLTLLLWFTTAAAGRAVGFV